jgi:hypothetical protein
LRQPADVRDFIMRIRRDLPKDIYPSADEVAEFAYELLLAEMSAPVGMTDLWRIAETELLERGARRVLAAHGRRTNRRRDL